MIQRETSNNTNFVKPDAVEYQYTDANLIDRNKSSN